MGITSITLVGNGAPLALTPALASAPWLLAVMTAVASGDGGILACASTPVGGGKSHVLFHAATALSPLSFESAQGASNATLIARFLVPVSSQLRANSSADAGGWISRETASCVLDAATLVTPREGVFGFVVSTAPSTMLVTLGVPVPVMVWRSTWPLPTAWMLGPAVTAAVSTMLPAGLQFDGRVGDSDGGDISELIAESYEVDPSATRVTVFGATVITTILASPLLQFGNMTTVTAAYLTAGSSPISMLSLLSKDGRSVTIVLPNISSACPTQRMDASSGRASSLLRMTSAPCPLPSIALLIKQSRDDESAATADVCASAGYWSQLNATQTLNDTSWLTVDAVEASSQSPAGIARFRRGGAIACPPLCSSSSLDPRLLEGASAAEIAAAERMSRFISNAASSMPGAWDSSESLQIALTADAGFGWLYVAPCLDLAVLPIRVDLGTVCANASDARSAGAFGWCFWGQAADCTPCPTGALCPGGYRLWSAPGYYAPDETSLELPQACAYPAKSRCVGWDESAGATACGPGYLAGSWGCSLCAAGYYADVETSGGACLPCAGWSGKAASPLLPFGGVAIAVGGIAGAGVLLGGLALLIAARTGGSRVHALRRTLSFMLVSYTALQLVAEIARVTPPSAPPFVAAVFSALRTLQFRGPAATPVACTTLSPLTVPTIVMASALALELTWLTVLVAWLTGLTSSNRAATGARSACSRACTSRPLLVASQAAILVAGAISAMVASSAFGVLACTPVTMTIQEYLLAGGDGTSAAVSLGFNVADVRANSTVLGQAVTVSLLDSAPGVICGEGAHRAVASLAIASIVVFVVGLPIFSVVVLRCIAFPAALRAEAVPAVLRPLDRAPHVSFGGGNAEPVRVMLLGHARPTPMRPARPLTSAAPGRDPADIVSEWEVYSRLNAAASNRRAAYVREGGGSCSQGVRAASSTLCGVGSRYSSAIVDESLKPPAVVHGTAALRANSVFNMVRPPGLVSPRNPAVDEAAIPATQLQEQGRHVPPRLRTAHEAPTDGGGLPPLTTSLGVVVRDCDVIDAPVKSLLCGCGCSRYYARNVQTGADVIDSSLALRSHLPIAAFTASDFRASQFMFVPLQWALLSVAAAANAAVTPVSASTAAMIARGALLVSLFLATLAAYIAARPFRPHAEWMMPLRGVILVVSALGALYSAIAGALLRSQTQGLSSATSALGYIVAILAVAIAPVFVSTFIASQLSASSAHRKLVALLSAWRQQAANAAAVTEVPKKATLGPDQHTVRRHTGLDKSPSDFQRAIDKAIALPGIHRLTETETEKKKRLSTAEEAPTIVPFSPTKPRRPVTIKSPQRQRVSERTNSTPPLQATIS